MHHILQCVLKSRWLCVRYCILRYMIYCWWLCLRYIWSLSMWDIVWHCLLGVILRHSLTLLKLPCKVWSVLNTCVMHIIIFISTSFIESTYLVFTWFVCRLCVNISFCVWENLLLATLVFVPASKCYIGCVCENFLLAKFVLVPVSRCCNGRVCVDLLSLNISVVCQIKSL